jgi:hypothetical protein
VPESLLARRRDDAPAAALGWELVAARAVLRRSPRCRRCRRWSPCCGCCCWVESPKRNRYCCGCPDAAADSAPRGDLAVPSLESFPPSRFVPLILVSVWCWGFAVTERCDEREGCDALGRSRRSQKFCSFWELCVCQIGRPPILPAIIGGSKCPNQYLVNHLPRKARVPIRTAGVRKTVSSHKLEMTPASTIGVVSP